MENLFQNTRGFNGQYNQQSAYQKYQKKTMNVNSKPFKPKDLDTHLPGFSALIRHGERADNVDYKAMEIEIEQMQDPPLTPLGILQAEETGLYLKDYLKEKGFDEQIEIHSSPFLRCLQTACQIAQQLSIKKIKVNYMISEWMKGQFFDSNPIDTLLIRNKDLKYIKDKYLPEGMDIIDNTLDVDQPSEYFAHRFSRNNDKLLDKQYYAYAHQSYPEEWMDSKNRCKIVQNDLYWSTVNTKPKNNGRLTARTKLYVTHGAMVKQFAQIMRGGQNGAAKYCAVSGMYVQDRRSNLNLDMYDQHITTEKSEQKEIDISKLSEEQKLAVELGYSNKIYQNSEEIQTKI